MRSEEIIPEDLRRLLRQPHAKYALSCAGLVLAVAACFFGVRTIANRRVVPLGSRMSKIDQASVQRVLMRNGLSDYTIVDGQLFVPTGKRADYLTAFNQVDVGPKDPNAIIIKATGNGSLLMTNEERRTRLEVAKQDAAAELLRSFAGVEDAYVRFDESSTGGFRPTKEIKAVVLIQPTSTIDAKLISSIRRTVAAFQSRTGGVECDNRESAGQRLV